MRIGYARVSKGDEQDTRLQTRALKQAGVSKVFEEKSLRRSMGTPRIATHARAASQRRRRRRVEARSPLAVSARSDSRHGEDRRRGRRLSEVSPSQSTTTSAAGRMLMQIPGSFAEFERSMIRERTRAGLDAARAQCHLWRPPARC